MKLSKIILGTLGIGLVAAAGIALEVHAEEAPAKKDTPAPAAAPPPAPKVSFVQLSPQTVPQKFERLGVVEPSRVAAVNARVKGYLSERLFEEGQTVEEGQLLYRIDPRTFEAAVKVQDAELQDARARFELAERDLTRARSLSESGGISKDRLDAAEIEKDRAAATMARAEASRREAELDLGFTEVFAPTSGIVGKATRDKGDLVDDSDATVLTTITRISPVYVTYGLGEVDYLQLQQDGKLDLKGGVTFQVVLKNGETFEETGTLNYQSSQFEPSTGMLRIRVEFPNTKGVLRPNQFVKIIEDHGPRGNVLSVPKQSVIQSPGGALVFVINDKDVLEPRPVKTGDWIGQNWEIASGLQAGDRVMVDGLLKSRPGSAVSPTPYEPRTTE